MCASWARARFSSSPRQRGEALRRHTVGRSRRDQGVRVGGVADHRDTHACCGIGGDGSPLRAEDAAVGCEQVGALHAGAARSCADQQGEVATVEAHRGVIGHLDVLEQTERAVLQLERGTLRGAEPLRDLQQSQTHLLIRAEQVVRRDAEQ